MNVIKMSERGEYKGRKRKNDDKKDVNTWANNCSNEDKSHSGANRSGAILYVPKIYRFYVGCNEYKLIRRQNAVNDFRVYFQEVMNQLYGYLKEKSCFKQRSIVDNSIFILAHLIQSILRYNRVFVPYQMTLVESDYPIHLGEPIWFQKINAHSSRCGNRDNEGTRRAQQLKIFFAKALIERVLSRDQSFCLKISYSNELSVGSGNFSGTKTLDRVDYDNSHQNYYNSHQNRSKGRGRSLNEDDETDSEEDERGALVKNRANELLLPENDILNRLFIMADHFCTHFIEIYRHGRTDWINHTNFGTRGGVTAHTVFKLTSAITSNHNGGVTSIPLLTGNISDAFQSHQDSTTLFSFGNTMTTSANLSTLTNPVFDPTSLLHSIF